MTNYPYKNISVEERVRELESQVEQQNKLLHRIFSVKPKKVGKVDQIKKTIINKMLLKSLENNNRSLSNRKTKFK